MVTECESEQELTENQRVARIMLLEQVHGIRIVERWVETKLIWQVVERALLLLVRRENLSSVLAIIFICVQFCYSLIFLILIEICDIIDLEGGREACIVPQKCALWADNRVDLTHRLHDFQVVVVELRGHQVYVPHSEVRVEENNVFHCEFGEVWEVLQEA